MFLLKVSSLSDIEYVLSLSPSSLAPSSQVDSQWEDCSYRIDSLNLILFTTERLKNGLDSVKKLMEVENYDNENVKQRLGEVLDSFIEDLYQPLPDLPEQGFNQLDRLTREHRIQEWAALRDDCGLLRKNLSITPLLEMVVEVEEYVYRLKSMAYEVRRE